jgi:hypothetical protein
MQAPHTKPAHEPTKRKDGEDHILTVSPYHRITVSSLRLGLARQVRRREFATDVAIERSRRGLGSVGPGQRSDLDGRTRRLGPRFGPRFRARLARAVVLTIIAACFESILACGLAAFA